MDNCIGAYFLMNSFDTSSATKSSYWMLLFDHPEYDGVNFAVDIAYLKGLNIKLLGLRLTLMDRPERFK